ncbi:hypothetical protein AURDEDRAFT_43195, partial [Auricularia subglabra TFB-10046 SS5]
HADEHFYTTSTAEVNAAFPRYYSEHDCCRIFKTQTESDGLVPLYRVYNPPWVFDHWYTTNYYEAQAAVRLGSQIDEGIAGYVRTTAGCGSVPLYMLYKIDPNRVGSADHFYTTSEVERDAAVAGAGYTYKGITAYVW